MSGEYVRGGNVEAEMSGSRRGDAWRESRGVGVPCSASWHRRHWFWRFVARPVRTLPDSMTTSLCKPCTPTTARRQTRRTYASQIHRTRTQSTVTFHTTLIRNFATVLGDNLLETTPPPETTPLPKIPPRDNHPDPNRPTTWCSDPNPNRPAEWELSKNWH